MARVMWLTGAAAGTVVGIVIAAAVLSSRQPPVDDAPPAPPPGDDAGPAEIDASAPAPPKAPSHPGGVAWAQLFEGSKEPTLRDVAASSAGFVVVSGRLDGEAVVLRIDAEGAIVWDRRLGQGRGEGVAAGAGRIAVTFQLDSDASAFGAPAVAVLDDAGRLLWSKPIGAEGGSARAVAIAQDGGVIVASEGPSENTRAYTLVAALGPAGEARWEKRVGADDGIARPTSLVAGADGGVLLGGVYDRHMTFGGASHRARMSGSVGFVAKLDPGGAEAWLAPLGEVSERLNAALVAVDGEGSVFVASMADNGKSGGVFGPPTVTLLSKLDPRGKVVFTRRFGEDVWAEGLAIDPGGGVLLSAQFAGAADLGAGVLRGAGDGLLARIDASGKTLWSARAPLRGRLAVVAGGRAVLAGEHKPEFVTREEAAVGAVAASAPPDAGAEPPIQKPSLAIYQFFQLDPVRDGVAGKLTLMQDARITKEDHAEACFSWQPLLGLGPRFDTAPINAAVRLLDASGKELDGAPLDHPLASIEVWRLYEDARPTYAVAENDSICAGSWRGIMTSLREVREGKIVTLSAASPGGGERAQIVFNLGLRGDVRVVPARSGGGKDILYARSGFARESPVDGGPSFETWLSRFSHEGGQWVRRERVVPENWLFGSGGPGSFPERKEFP